MIGVTVNAVHCKITCNENVLGDCAAQYYNEINVAPNNVLSFSVWIWCNNYGWIPSCRSV